MKNLEYLTFILVISIRKEILIRVIIYINNNRIDERFTGKSKICIS